MHLYNALQELYAQKHKLETIIANLEELQVANGCEPRQSMGAKRRGRKSMGMQERRDVSRRMKKYWASRRKQHQ